MVQTVTSILSQEMEEERAFFIYFKILAHMITEAEKSHLLLTAGRPQENW